MQKTRHDFDYYNRDPGMRASDADREAIGDRLRQHHTDGRLDSEEFNERIDRCYAAKTVGELNELLADLPGEHKQPDQSYGTPHRRMYLRGVIPFAPVLIALIVVSALSGWHHGAWHAVWLIVPVFFLTRMMLWRRGRLAIRYHHTYSDEQPI